MEGEEEMGREGEGEGGIIVSMFWRFENARCGFKVSDTIDTV